LEGFQEGFLNGILRIFPVMGDALGNAEELTMVALYELFESGNIPILAGMDKIKVIVCHFPDVELCCVYRHIVPIAFVKTVVKALNAARWLYCTTTVPVILGWTEQK
jgi:hypothetical protein